MRTGKQPRPIGACHVCQGLTRRREVLNHRCDRAVNGRRCWGTYKSAVAFLWDPCDACEATGKVGSQACAECKGFGWRLYA